MATFSLSKKRYLIKCSSILTVTLWFIVCSIADYVFFCCGCFAVSMCTNWNNYLFARLSSCPYFGLNTEKCSVGCFFPFDGNVSKENLKITYAYCFRLEMNCKKLLHLPMIASSGRPLRTLSLLSGCHFFPVYFRLHAVRWFLSARKCMWPPTSFAI